MTTYALTVSALMIANVVAHAVWISALVGWWLR